MYAYRIPRLHVQVHIIMTHVILIHMYTIYVYRCLYLTLLLWPLSVTEIILIY